MLTTEILDKIRRIEIHTRHLVNDSFAGEYHAVFKGQGLEFEEVRPYQFGDEVRTIDWNVTARMGYPYIKRFVETRELTVMLVVDASRSSDFGSVSRFKRDLAAELAAVLSFAATTNNDKVGLLFFTDQVEMVIPPRKGRRHVLRLIRELLTFKPIGYGTNLKLALDRINQILKRRSIVFLVSDFLAEPDSYRRTMFVTNRRHDVIALDLNDPLETEIGNVGVLTLEDAETGDLIWVDTNSQAWQDEFRQRNQAFEAHKQAAFRRAGVDVIDIHTDHDYVTALTEFFQRRTKRRGR
ncbi:DUF58 domain-containing protein [Anaerolineales bacterium HSG24]|nr:DUF58 domain-containing protein [Anaerolineales bacterium HSG24]